MNTIQVSIPQPTLVKPTDTPLSLPVAIPSLPDIIQLAKALHAAGQPWEGTAFGWPADYSPEIKEENAVFEEYDENNMVQMVVAPRWSPASFCIGINDLWFVSVTWEFGVAEEPWVYLEDDYGYQFDETPQIARLKARQQASIAAPRSTAVYAN